MDAQVVNVEIPQPPAVFQARRDMSPVQVKLRMPADVREKVKSLAKEHGQKSGALMRTAINAWCGERGKKARSAGATLAKLAAHRKTSTPITLGLPTWQATKLRTWEVVAAVNWFCDLEMDNKGVSE